MDFAYGVLATLAGVIVLKVLYLLVVGKGSFARLGLASQRGPVSGSRRATSTAEQRSACWLVIRSGLTSLRTVPDAVRPGGRPTERSPHDRRPPVGAARGRFRSSLRSRRKPSFPTLSSSQSRAATWRAIASDAVMPGDSMPPRWMYAPSRQIRKSACGPPGCCSFGRYPTCPGARSSSSSAGR